MKRSAQILLEMMVLNDYEAWYKLLNEQAEAKDFIRKNEKQFESFLGNSYKIREVRLGIEHNLTYAQIEHYAFYSYTVSQMEQIRIAYEKGLTEEQVDVVASPSYNVLQMGEIIDGFVNGLSIEQVKSYANPSYSWEIMLEKRMKLVRELQRNKLANILNYFE